MNSPSSVQSAAPHPSLLPALRRAEAAGDQLSGAAADAIERYYKALDGICSGAGCLPGYGIQDAAKEAREAIGE